VWQIITIHVHCDTVSLIIHSVYRYQCCTVLYNNNGILFSKHIHLISSDSFTLHQQKDHTHWCYLWHDKPPQTAHLHPLLLTLHSQMIQLASSYLLHLKPLPKIRPSYKQGTSIWKTSCGEVWEVMSNNSTTRLVPVYWKWGATVWQVLGNGQLKYNILKYQACFYHSHLQPQFWVHYLSIIDSRFPAQPMFFLFNHPNNIKRSQ
jgi:hypothetical protein